jgi:hypothetical protein
VRGAESPSTFLHAPGDGIRRPAGKAPRFRLE